MTSISACLGQQAWRRCCECTPTPHKGAPRSDKVRNIPFLMHGLQSSRELYGLQKRGRVAVLQPTLAGDAKSAEKYGIAMWAVAQSQKPSSKGPHPKNCTSLNETNSEAKYHGVGPTQAPLEVDGTRVASPRLSPEDVDRVCSGSFHRLMAASVSTHGPISISGCRRLRSERAGEPCIHTDVHIVMRSHAPA